MKEYGRVVTSRSLIRVLCTAAVDASGHYRIRQPAEQINRHEPSMSIHVPDGIIIDLDHGQVGNIVLDFMPDLVVLQRPMWWYMPEVIDQLHASNIPVIVELDDDFHAAHPSNSAFMRNHPKRNPKQNWHHLGECVKRADWVTVSTPALAKRYGAHGRCTVIRNAVDDWWLDIDLKRKAEGSPKLLGWTGSVLHHPTDPQATRGAVPQVLAETQGEWSFFCVGAGDYGYETAKAFGWRLANVGHFELGQPHFDFTAYKPLELHPYVTSILDLGIVPLADLAFNHGKSGLKGLEFAALGIPFIATATPEYKRLDEDGIGVTVRKQGLWSTELRHLMSSPETRKLYAAHAKERVREAYTASKNYHRWAEVWQRVARDGVRKRLG